MSCLALARLRSAQSKHDDKLCTTLTRKVVDLQINHERLF